AAGDLKVGGTASAARANTAVESSDGSPVGRGKVHRRCINRQGGGQPMLQLEERARRLDFGGQARVQFGAVDDAPRLRVGGAGQVDEVQSVVFAQRQRRDQELR